MVDTKKIRHAWKNARLRFSKLSPATKSLTFLFFLGTVILLTLFLISKRHPLYLSSSTASFQSDPSSAEPHNRRPIHSIRPRDNTSLHSRQEHHTVDQEILALKAIENSTWQASISPYVMELTSNSVSAHVVAFDASKCELVYLDINLVGSEHAAKSIQNFIQDGPARIDTAWKKILSKAELSDRERLKTRIGEELWTLFQERKQNHDDFCFYVARSDPDHAFTSLHEKIKLSRKFRKVLVFKPLIPYNYDIPSVAIRIVNPRHQVFSNTKTHENKTKETVQHIHAAHLPDLVRAVALSSSLTFVKLSIAPDDAFQVLTRLVSSGVLCAHVDHLVVSYQNRKFFYNVQDEKYPHFTIAYEESKKWLQDNGIEKLNQMSSWLLDQDNCRTSIEFEMDPHLNIETSRQIADNSGVNAKDSSHHFFHPASLASLPVSSSRSVPAEKIFSNVSTTIPWVARAGSSVFYAVLAGKKKFAERVGAASETWFRDLPDNNVAVYTNFDLTLQDDLNHENPEQLTASQIAQIMKAKKSFTVAPSNPQIEPFLDKIQSWSHLVRVREAWDNFMQFNPEIKWLALVDDDTFVYPETVSSYVTRFKDEPRWGGSLEMIRIDNGDGDTYAKWLRSFDNSSCVLAGEDRSPGAKDCKDVMCRHCPAIPQGGSILLSRALVEILRPYIEVCEEKTTNLCEFCGSQRLHYCINFYTNHTELEYIYGMFRAPFLLEPHKSSREKHPLTYHRFDWDKGRYMHTGSIRGDYQEFWNLLYRVRLKYEQGKRFDPRPTFEDVVDLIKCNGVLHYADDRCSGEPFF